MNKLARRTLFPVACSLFPLFLGCNSAPSPAPVAQVTPQAPAITYPARPTTAPAPFKLFHHYDSSFTLTTADKATDDQLAALVWQLRDAARTNTFDHIHIPQKDVDAAGSSAWFHIYRGAKCASEKYTEAKLPCGNSYHASADYTYSTKPVWDKGVLLHNEKETALWNPDASYTATSTR